MLLRPAVVVIRRVVVALVVSVFVGVTAIAQTTPAWAVESWITPVDLSATGQNADNPQIVAAPNNTLTAIWYRYDGSNDIIQTRSSTDGGATWSSVVDLSATGPTRPESADRGGPEQHPYRHLAEVRRVKIHYSNQLQHGWWCHLGRVSWISPQPDNTPGGPQIVAAPNNTLTAIWGRSDGSKYIIQSSSLAPSSSSSTSADPGVPGIFLTVAGPVGRSASESPIYYGADRVSVTSTYLLTVTRVSNITPTITTLAEGTIDADGSFSSMTRLPALTPGVYNVQMVGTHVNGSTLQLTSQVTIGGVGEFTSIGANIPVIK